MKKRSKHLSDDANGHFPDQPDTGAVKFIWHNLHTEVHEEALKTNPKLFAKQEAIRDKQERKMEQERQIISMYRSNISIDEIWKKSGYASRSSVFRVLNKYGINLNRGKFKGPLGKRKPKASTGQEE